LQTDDEAEIYDRNRPTTTSHYFFSTCQDRTGPEGRTKKLGPVLRSAVATKTDELPFNGKRNVRKVKRDHVVKTKNTNLNSLVHEVSNTTW